MSMTFYAGAERDDEIELDVEEPGSGWLFARVLDGEHDGTTVVAGSRLAEMLGDVTEAVLSNDPFPRVRGLGLLSAPQCRALLPQLQKAVMLAVSSTDRYERIYDEGTPLAVARRPQLCVNCNQGSDYSGQVTISSRCSQFGHRPFGTGPDARWAGEAVGGSS